MLRSSLTLRGIVVFARSIFIRIILKRREYSFESKLENYYFFFFFYFSTFFFIVWVPELKISDMDIRSIILNNNWQSLVKNKSVENVCATLKNLLV